MERGWNSQWGFPGLTLPWECASVPALAPLEELLELGQLLPCWRLCPTSGRSRSRGETLGNLNQVTSAHQLGTGTARGLNWAGTAFLGNPLPTTRLILKFWGFFLISVSCSLGNEGWEDEGEQDSFGNLDQKM